jgi:hypothetical protein
MTTELDFVAANAPDNATVSSGNITDEQHAEAIHKLLMNGHALAASPAIPTQGPTSARKYAVQQNYGLKSQDRAGAVVL